MSNIIKRFKEDLQLAGYAKRSIDSYASSVLRLQRFYNKPLKDITEEDLRQYWVCCQSEFGWSAASLRISYSGIQHFFTRTLVRSWNIFSEIKWKREETLPTILSLQEVRKIIDALPTQQSRTFYLTLYSLGLRLREATTLQVRDILSERGLVHIHTGKGAMHRMVPLPKITLLTLRKYYKTHRNPQWIFPALGHNGGKDAQFAKTHVSDSGVQGALRSTLKRLGFKKHVHPHVFRHAYATHLLEANIPIRHVQNMLGHKSLKSTMIYLHVTTLAQEDSHERVAQVMQGVLS
ncbi:MAG: tyrosine-type recombinase/integrase [Desulfobacterales bacterium]